MAVEKFSISFDPELLAMVRDAADDDETLSAWMAEAARQRIRGLAMDQFLDEVMHETGMTEEELLAAAAEARADAIHVRPKPAKGSAAGAATARRRGAANKSPQKPQGKSQSKSRRKAG